MTDEELMEYQCYRDFGVGLIRACSAEIRCWPKLSWAQRQEILSAEKQRARNNPFLTPWWKRDQDERDKAL